jgi:hypothetical protein
MSKTVYEYWSGGPDLFWQRLAWVCKEWERSNVLLS